MVTDMRHRFIPNTKDDSNKLLLSKPAYDLFVDRFGISSRLDGLIRSQTPPSSLLKYDPNSGHPTYIQYLYSGVIRAFKASDNPVTTSRSVLDWQRFITWTGRDMRTGVTTIVVFRCPTETQERLLRLIGDEAEGQEQLLRHPMLVHAMLMEDLVPEWGAFSGNFARPLYALVSRCYTLEKVR